MSSWCDPYCFCWYHSWVIVKSYCSLIEMSFFSSIYYDSIVVLGFNSEMASYGPCSLGIIGATLNLYCTDSLLYRYIHIDHNSEYFVIIWCLAWMTSWAFVQFSCLEWSFQYDWIYDNIFLMTWQKINKWLSESSISTSVGHTYFPLWELGVKNTFVLSLLMSVVDISILVAAWGWFVSDDVVTSRKWWESACLTNSTQVTNKR